MLSVASVVKVLEVNQYRQRAAGTWDGCVVIMVTDGRGQGGSGGGDGRVILRESGVDEEDGSSDMSRE